MKKIIFSILIVSCSFVNAQMSFGSIKDKMSGGITAVGVGLTEEEIVSGLKEALGVGIDKSTAKASKSGGFNKNNLIKIPFPEEAKKMEDKLRLVGMGAQVDSFEFALNKSAELASKEAAPIFLQAVKNMNVSDGLNILRGADNAATTYLNKTTNESLYEVFKPIIEKALKTVGVTQYWNPLASRYNKIPLTTKVNPDLEDYTTKKAIDGLFKLIALEEKKIRDNPSARSTELLKKVFAE